ncbi:MAG TPA: hypothetical protein VN851_13010, partial [Thermoanaerobaculia bacterium]|nr:hypothetical protein [Thermoanaerobaculia bacterium]
IAQREQVERRISDLTHQLQSFDLDRQNLQVGFLNQRIAERTFSWSTLLDRLARELPSDVRLLSLTPTTGDVRSRPSAAAKKPATGDRIPLEIDGEAKSVQAMLLFVDHLFARAEFADPDPQNQQEDESGLIKFKLSVDYLPQVAAAQAAASSSFAPPVSPVAPAVGEGR